MLVGSKTAFCVWSGGGAIPYSFQNIPLCPGFVHESVGKSMMMIQWWKFINNATKTMMYITYAINNDVLLPGNNDVYYLITTAYNKI